MGKTSLWTHCPLPRCVQLVGSEQQEVWPSGSRGYRKDVMHPKGDSGGGFPGPHLSLILSQATLEEAGHCPGSPEIICSRPELVALCGSKSDSHGLSEKQDQRERHTVPGDLSPVLCLGLGLLGGGLAPSRCFIFLTSGIFPHLFPSPTLWGGAGSPWLGRGRTLEEALSDPTDASPGMGLGIPSCLAPSQPTSGPCPHLPFPHLPMVASKEPALAPTSRSWPPLLTPADSSCSLFGGSSFQIVGNWDHASSWIPL